MGELLQFNLTTSSSSLAVTFTLAVTLSLTITFALAISLVLTLALAISLTFTFTAFAINRITKGIQNRLAGRISTITGLLLHGGHHPQKALQHGVVACLCRRGEREQRNSQCRH